MEGGGKVGDLFWSEVVFKVVAGVGEGETEFFLDGAQNGGFEAGEREI